MTTSACARGLLSMSLLVVCLLNVAAQQPSPSPSPSVAASPSPSATATPEASPTPRDPMSTPTFNGLRLRSIGPAFTSGRISGFAIDPANPTRYYVAVASGGVWKTTNAGVTWTPIFDNEASYSIGAIAVDPKNFLTVWVGSGENNTSAAFHTAVDSTSRKTVAAPGAMSVCELLNTLDASRSIRKIPISFTSLPRVHFGDPAANAVSSKQRTAARRGRAS